jgi:hypothetical protein
MKKHERPWLEGAKGAVGETSQLNPTAPARPEQAPNESPFNRQPEAAELPEGATMLAAALQELVAILPRLADALDAQRQPPVPRLAYRLDDLAAALNMSRRALERERSAGRLPKPDLHIGRAPLWKPETIRAWLERGGRP